MSCLGVAFSLDEKTVLKLKSFKSDEKRLDFLDDIEEQIMDNEPESFAEFDKSWDALHRSLTDGKLDWTNGTYPLNHVILGGQQIYYDDDYTITLSNMMGQTVTTLHANNQQETLKVIDFPAGLYNVSITDDNGNRHNEKVTIIH